MKTYKKRIHINQENLLAPLTENSGVGEYLRYDPLYDHIRQARKEDDDQLSQGIWQHELKKADFITVEALCAEALEFRTKDIQIAAWLTEAWISLDGLSGFSKGLSLCRELIATYWSNIHPQEDEDGFEARIRLFEWMNEQFANRLMRVPLTFHSMAQQNAVLTLADWLSALNTESVAKRSTDYQKALDDAAAKGALTLAVFRKNLQTTDSNFLQKMYVDTKKSEQELLELMTINSKKLGKSAASFARIKTCLTDIARIMKTTLEQRDLPLTYDPRHEETVQNTTNLKPNIHDHLIEHELPTQKIESKEPVHVNAHIPESEIRSIVERKDAYQALREMSQFLSGLDPHSPTPSLLDLIVGWEDKNLADILESLSVAPSSTQRIIRMLASALPEEKEKKR